MQPETLIHCPVSLYYLVFGSSSFAAHNLSGHEPAPFWFGFWCCLLVLGRVVFCLGGFGWCVSQGQARIYSPHLLNSFQVTYAFRRTQRPHPEKKAGTVLTDLVQLSNCSPANARTQPAVLPTMNLHSVLPREASCAHGHLISASQQVPPHFMEHACSQALLGQRALVHSQAGQRAQWCAAVSSLWHFSLQLAGAFDFLPGIRTDLRGSHSGLVQLPPVVLPC